MNATTLTRRDLLASLALAGPGWVAAQGNSSSAPGDARAPALPRPGAALALADLPLLDGSMFRASAADGQVLVVYWWASWCPFCALQSPHMEALWRAQRGNGLQMLGLSIDRKADDAQAYRVKRGYSFPSGWVTPVVAAALPKPKGLPVTVVRGRDGRVLMGEAGQLFPEDVELIAKYL